MSRPEIESAREAVREIASRRAEVNQEAARTVLPWWYVIANGAAAWTVVSSVDYGDRSLAMMVIGLALISVLSAYGVRTQRVKVFGAGHRGPARAAIPVAIGGVLAVYLVAAVALRFADVPFAHTIAGGAMMAALLAVTPWVRRSVRAGLLGGQA